MQTQAVVLKEPGKLGLAAVHLKDMAPSELLVDVEWTGISTGTERLLWSGRMPHFPGMGYPLIPGYETVGRVSAVGPEARTPLGAQVFVPGASAFKDVRSLFGGAARRLIVADERVVRVDGALGARATLLALAATAYHVAPFGEARAPDLIVGHGALGRLLARLTVISGAAPPTVWEVDPARRTGSIGYEVIDPASDKRRDYACICDVSGAADMLNALVTHLAPGGEIVLAGFYDKPLSFDFPPAFMREARLRIAAQWRRDDLMAVRDLVASRRLSLDGLITNHASAQNAGAAYEQAFENRDCLKMVLDWRGLS